MTDAVVVHMREALIVWGRLASAAVILRVRDWRHSRTGTQIGRLNNTPLTDANRSATLRTQ